MPVRPLPLEVVGLIVDQLAGSIKDEEESRSMGIWVALVCKAWKEMGLEMAWWTVSIDTGEENDGLLQLLHQRPATASRIRHLEVSGPIELETGQYAESMSHRFLPKLQQILEHSTRLFALRLRDSRLVIDLLETLSRQPYRHLVRHLQVQKAMTSSAGHQRLLHALATFSGLTFLSFLGFITEEVWQTPSPPINASIRVPRLVLSLGGQPDTFRQSIEAFTSIIDLSSVQQLQMGMFNTSEDIFSWLSDGANLVNLQLSYESALHITATLPFLVNAFPHLTSLATLHITATPVADIAEADFSPVTLSAFLAALPPTLRYGHFGGFHFRYDARVAWVEPWEEEVLITCMCALSAEDTEGGSPQSATAAAVMDLAGVQSWYLLLYPSETNAEVDQRPGEEEEEEEDSGKHGEEGGEEDDEAHGEEDGEEDESGEEDT